MVYYKISYDSLAGGPQRVYIIDIDLKNPALEFKMPHSYPTMRVLSAQATTTIDGAVVAHISMSNGVWSAWENITNAVLQGGPDACTSTTNKLQVFYRGTDNACKWITYSGGVWSSVTDLGGTLSADPSGTSYEAGQLMVFARNSAGALIKRNYTDATWGAWSTELGGAVTGGPDGASWSNATENR